LGIDGFGGVLPRAALWVRRIGQSASAAVEFDAF
jgi:hypothetical protein